MTTNTTAQDALLRVLFPTNWNKKSKRVSRPRPQLKFDALFTLPE